MVVKTRDPVLKKKKKKKKKRFFFQIYIPIQKINPEWKD